MADKWYFILLGEELGPVSFFHLLALAEDANLTADDQVRQGIAGPFVPARTVPGLITDATPTAEELHDLSELDFRFVDSGKAGSKPQSLSPLPDTSAAVPPGESKSANPHGNWLCRILGQELGPMTFGDLWEMAHSGALSPDDKVMVDDAAGWVAARTVANLFAEVADADVIDIVQPTRPTTSKSTSFEPTASEPTTSEPAVSEPPVSTPQRRDRPAVTAAMAPSKPAARPQPAAPEARPVQPRPIRVRASLMDRIREHQRVIAAVAIVLPVIVFSFFSFSEPEPEIEPPQVNHPPEGAFRVMLKQKRLKVRGAVWPLNDTEISEIHVQKTSEPADDGSVTSTLTFKSTGDNRAVAATVTITYQTNVMKVGNGIEVWTYPVSEFVSQSAEMLRLP